MTASKDSSHIKPALANGQNVQLQYAWRGDPVHATGRPESVGDHIQSAALYSTAPYRDPKQVVKPPKRQGCSGKDGTCKAHVIHELGLCVFHARQAGVYDAWTDKEVASSTSQD